MIARLTNNGAPAQYDSYHTPTVLNDGTTVTPQNNS